MRERRRSLALVALLLVSTLAGVVPTATAGGPPSGMVAVSETNINDIRPTGVTTNVSAADLDGAVYVSGHASTTEVDLVTDAQADEIAKGASPSDVAQEAVCSSPAAGKTPQFDCSRDASMSLVISDDVHHDGRRVAVRAGVIKDAFGYVPEYLAIANNETGETWRSPTTVADGWLVADVEHFSSNAVSFEGTVSVEATPALNGDTFTTNISDVSAVDNFDINVTGSTQTEWDNVSATGLANGNNLAVNPAGHRVTGPNASEPEVVFTGNLQTKSESLTGSVSPGGSASVSVDGNQNPNSPTLTVTGRGTSKLNPYFDYQDHSYQIGGKYNGLVNAEATFDGPPSVISGIKLYANPNGGSHTLDIYLVEEDADEVFGEGTLVRSGVTIDGGSGQKTIDIQDYEPSTSGNLTVEFVTTSSSGGKLEGYAGTSTNAKVLSNSIYGISNSGLDMTFLSGPSGVNVDDNNGHSASFGELLPGETKTKSLAVGTSSSALDFSAFKSGSVDWQLDFTERTVTEDVALDIDGDGINDVSHSGQLSDGATASYQIPSLDPSDGSATVSTAAGSTVGAEVRLKEVSETRDPSISVNGHTTSYTGTLSDGETVALDTNTSWIQSGENQINVTVGDGSLSADAPTPATGLDYSHDAKSSYSVNYSAEALTVRYGVGKSYTSDQSGVSMTIPFDNTVYEMRDVEKRVNGGSWTAVDPMNYRITDANELVADIGSVSKGDTVKVRANGSRVETSNMSITVERATAKGNKLDSKLSIDSISENAYLRFASSGESKRIVYPVNESWDSADGYATIQSNGQQDLFLPSAPAGGTFRIQTIPVKATPNQGDVEVSVLEPRQEEPQFYVRPGDAPSDTVEFTYLNAKPDTKYLLYSKSNGVVRDSGTANSPVTLTDDDSAERLVFRVDESGTSDPPNRDGWTDGFPPPGQFAKQSASGGNLPVVLLVSGLGIAVLWYARSRYRGASGVTGLFGRALSSNVVLGSLIVAVVGVGAAIGGVSLPPGAGLLLLVTGVPLATYLGLRRTGQYSHVAFGAVTAVALILGLQLLGENVVSSVLSNLGPSMPIIAIGGLYVVYKAVKAYRRGKTVKLSVRGFRRGSSNDEDDKGGP
ncbi:hypothetical protein [Halorussus aquaticus]|uniref:Uncharacterized protein n=1 Tax=Halorussus aquaticus TaxID=2953748 RepID=A0ABD5PY45_9EURY|nr:hypothetical protein [Halorussus aquaticus]